MVYFFSNRNEELFVVETSIEFSKSDITKLEWLFSGGKIIDGEQIQGEYVGPRIEMISPWSTNAVEITQNMGVEGIKRIEKFKKFQAEKGVDPMLEFLYNTFTDDIFKIDRKPADIKEITDIAQYNESQGLALSVDEIKYLEALSERLGRPLTDSEVFGFSQVNSEHCRHKIFNGVFVIDGREKPFSLFQMIRKTSSTNPNRIVSAYADNVAFVEGPLIYQFAPEHPDRAAFFDEKEISSVLSLKAETHNFPTTVEPFNGAATGTGGEIRDRMAGGKGSLPLAGTAVYMTSYPRTKHGRPWETHTSPRKWLYQDPQEILIKASNGASDFGNKFGQPLICGSVLTFEHEEKNKKYGYDKVIMLAGGIGYARSEDSQKDEPTKGDRIIVMGGDNYRIGMGGGSVSSVATGEYDNTVELNAVQRSNPEMQKRVANVIRGLAEMEDNPIVSVHDHGAGGHLNALSELIETTGGIIEINKLPVGDKTLSFREIIGNESQERMGLLLHKNDIDLLKRISLRERAPFYDVGESTGDSRLIFKDMVSGSEPISLDLNDMFGNPPQTILEDKDVQFEGSPLKYSHDEIISYVEQVVQLEAVACKDWLTNKVDRSVTGRVAVQQTTGKIQLPLNNLGVMALDYHGTKGVATSIGHAPVSGIIDPASGSVLSVAEALTNIVWAPIEKGLEGISLSANWMWPAKNPGENARLYNAVEAISNFAIQLGINIPTGKDSLSMKQQYKEDTVFSPGTVIVSTVGEVMDITRVVTPEIKNVQNTSILYVEFVAGPFELGGSSFAQLLGNIGNRVPMINEVDYFKKAFNTVQELIIEGLVLAGHDIGSGGLITSLMEMCFPNLKGGMTLDFSSMESEGFMNIIFSEKPGIIIQIESEGKAIKHLEDRGINFFLLGNPSEERKLKLNTGKSVIEFDIDHMRDKWMESSYLLDKVQSGHLLASERYNNYKNQPLRFNFPEKYLKTMDRTSVTVCKARAAIIREKGVNGDREMAYALFAAGFEVKDVHMTDLISGAETLEDIQMIVFVGGFSNSDVLGSAKGWAGAFLYNKKARQSLKAFYDREDTLSLGVCNGCQLMMELNLFSFKKAKEVRMLHNDSNKFESSFLSVKLHESSSIMLKGMEGSELGIWVAHGEGKFYFGDKDPGNYEIPITYSYSAYPGNPNGSDFDAAAVCSENGRHLAMMPHLERSIFSWQWANYDEDKAENEQMSPWYQAFVNARIWIENF